MSLRDPVRNVGHRGMRVGSTHRVDSIPRSSENGGTEQRSCIIAKDPQAADIDLDSPATSQWDSHCALDFHSRKEDVAVDVLP